ncbi:hypothetical protein HDV05_002785, partial [Chytridiales sp. JEL 0842]
IVSQARSCFRTHKTKSIAWRKNQLKTLIDYLTANKDFANEAAMKDFRRSPGGHKSAEIVPTINEAIHALENLDDWVQPISNVEKPLMFLTDTAQIIHEPLGVVLIIAAWNFPFFETLIPMVSAIAAGNCVVIKPSEMAAHSAKLIGEVLNKVMDRQAVQVVQGGVEVTQKLLEQKWDHIFYTGNGHVGKIVMTAAAKNLTPVTLELGGKSPVYVEGDMDPLSVAKRLLWAKHQNCGQICIAPDYVLVKKSAAPALYEAFKKAYAEFFPSGTVKTDKHYNRIINIQHFK